MDSSGAILEEMVRAFAVGLLGCGCESEVFRTIEVADDPFGRSAGAGKRILIGNRLLVYLVPCGVGEDLPGLLAGLMRRGKEERDRNGYNRFRLVLAAERPEDAGREAALLAPSLVAGDGRLHVHVLPADNALVCGILGGA